MSPRPRKKEPIAANAFLEAIQFVGSICKDAGSPNETHISLGYNTATAYNGILATGCYIQEDIHCCPHSKLLIQALSKCGQSISFTQLDNHRLSILSGKFKVIIPGLDPTLLPRTIPDPAIAMIDDSFKVAIEAVGVLPNDNAQNIYGLSILMNGRSLVATQNGQLIFEYWHGIDLPSGIALPKALVNPLTQTTKKLAKFGYSQSSVTFYFDDGSWMKSQLYADKWPELNIFDITTNPISVQSEFWDAVAAVAPFSENGLVYFQPGALSSHAQFGAGASFEIVGYPPSGAFPIRQLALIKPHAQAVDFQVDNGRNSNALFFIGKNIRGLMAGVSK